MEPNFNSIKFEPYWLLVLAGSLSIMSGNSLGIIVGVGLLMLAWPYFRKPKARRITEHPPES